MIMPDINKTIVSFFVLLMGMALVLYGFWENPIYVWDEAIYAHNALEMTSSNQFAFLTLDNEPDLYNTKPPLAIWLMAISMKLFGANEFAVRLPSVIAFVFTISALIRFSKRHLGDYYYGILASIMLLGTKGLMVSHGARSGDLDSLLVLFSTLFCLNSIAICLQGERLQLNRSVRNSFLYLGLGFFTKSTAVFLLTPGVLICLIISGKLMVILRKRVFHISASILIAGIATYYIIEELINPGYWKAVFFSEYQRAWRDIMPWHKQRFTWYFDNLFKERFTPFCYILVPSIVVAFINRKSVTSQIVKYSAIISAAYLLFISLVPDKLEWYDLPVYPLLSLCLAAAASYVMEKLAVFWKHRIFLPLLRFVLLLAFSIPAIYVSGRINSQAPGELEREAWCLKEIQKLDKRPTRLKILMNVDHPVHVLSCSFYIKAWKRASQYSIVHDASSIQRGDTVLYSQPAAASLLTEVYSVDVVKNFPYGSLVRVN